MGVPRIRTLAPTLLLSLLLPFFSVSAEELIDLSQKDYAKELLKSKPNQAAVYGFKGTATVKGLTKDGEVIVEVEDQEEVVDCGDVFLLQGKNGAFSPGLVVFLEDAKKLAQVIAVGHDYVLVNREGELKVESIKRMRPSGHPPAPIVPKMKNYED